MLNPNWSVTKSEIKSFFSNVSSSSVQSRWHAASDLVLFDDSVRGDMMNHCGAGTTTTPNASFTSRVSYRFFRHVMGSHVIVGKYVLS